jgi:hypothetical protein
MAYETQSLAELFSPALLSFDLDCWKFSFERTLPIAIYVDATDDSDREIAENIAAWINEALQESGFTESDPIASQQGSFLQLNLTRTREKEDGPKFSERLREFRNKLIKHLREDVGPALKDANTAFKIVVAIGTVVVILSAGPTTAITVGFCHTSKSLDDNYWCEKLI